MAYSPQDTDSNRPYKTNKLKNKYV